MNRGADFETVLSETGQLRTCEGSTGLSGERRFALRFTSVRLLAQYLLPIDGVGNVSETKSWLSET